MKVQVTIFIFLLLSSCFSSKTRLSDKGENQPQSNIFVLDSTNLNLIEVSLNNPEIKQYFHFELEGRLPLSIIYNQKSDESIHSIKCFGYSVEIIKSEEDKGGSIIYLNHASQDEVKTTLIFKYPIEGLKITVEYIYDKDLNKWKENKTEVIEN